MLFEHIGFVALREYQRRLPERFRGLDTWPPWNGWRLGDDEQRRLPAWARVRFPDPLSAEAEEPRWHTAAFVQSAVRLYLSKRRAGAGEEEFPNHALRHITCLAEGGCDLEHDGDAYKASLRDPADRELFESYYGTEGSWGMVGDNTYKLKNLATVFFIHKADAVQEGGFGAFEFFTYELENRRLEGEDWDPPFLGARWPSDAEMFGLAGFPGREAFLGSLHAWLVDAIRRERSPLDAADEITQPLDRLLVDIGRLRARAAARLPVDAPRCMDELLPVPPWFRG